MQTPYTTPLEITLSRKFIIAYALNVFTIMEIAGSVTEFTRSTGRIRARAATRPKQARRSRTTTCARERAEGYRHAARSWVILIRDIWSGKGRASGR
jgi:hypothetical protein